MQIAPAGGPASERLSAVIAEFLGAVQSGDQPDRELLIQRHPDLAAELSSFFAAHDRMKSFAEPFSGPSASSTRFDDLTIGPDAAADLAGDDETIAPSQAGENTAGALPGRPGEHAGQARRFGDYVLLREIARGGMGVVYKARQTKLNRVVALKMILAGQLASPDDVRRFYAEAEAAANLEHSGVVPIYEVGESNGQHFFSMGFVDGHSLAAEVAAGPLTPRRAAELVAKIAEAVAFAHAKGVIHRDLKPANILLDQNDEPKVTDFGLAKRVETESGLTQSGAILGTPSYMPPEQAAGKTDEIGPLADVYSLGGILYCLLTGRPPFQAARPLETLLQVLNDDPVPPRRLNPGVPRDLETIALKCLAKEPARRYDSARDLADDLGRHLADQPILARPAGATERAWRWCRRNPWIAGLAAAVAVSLLAGIGVSSTLAILASNAADLARRNEAQAKGETARANAEQQAAAEAEKRAKEALVAAQAAEKIAERQTKVAQNERDRAQANLYPAAIQLADRAQRENNLANMQQRLESQQPAGGVDLRGWEWYYLRGLAFGAEQSFSGHEKYVESVAWHPAGELVASSSRDGFVKIWNAKDTTELASFQVGPDKSCELTWSKSGDRLLIAPVKSSMLPDREPQVLVWNRQTRSVEFSTPGSNAAWRPDGLQVAISSDGGVLLWNAETGKTQTHALMCTAKSPLDYSGDGSQFAVADAGLLKVLVCATSDGAVQQTLTGHLAPIPAIAFHPREARLVTGSSGGRDQARLWDLATSTAIKQFPFHSGGLPVSKVRWNKTGNAVALAYERPGVSGALVRVFDADGKQRIELATNQFAWEPAGERVAYLKGDHTVGIARIDGKGPDHTLRGHTATVYACDWSPDGTQLVSGSADVTAKIWDARGIEKPAAISAASQLAWQPGGKLVAVAAPARSVQLVDSTTWKTVKQIELAPTNTTCLAWNSSGTELGIATQSYSTRQGELTVWNIAKDAPARVVAVSNVRQVAFSPEGDRVLTHGQPVFDPLLRVYDKTALTEAAAHDFGRGANVFEFSSDGRLAYTRRATSGRSTSVLVQKGVNGKPECELKDIPGQVCALAFDTARNRLAVTAWHASSQAGEISVWDLDSQERLHSFSAHESNPMSVAFHPIEEKLVSAGGKSAILWDLVTGQELLSLDSDTGMLTSLVWSPDGRLLLANNGREIKVWSSVRGREREKPLPAAYFRRDVRAGGFF